MKITIKDRFRDELEIKVVVVPEDMKTKAIELYCNGTMSYGEKELDELIKALQKAKEELL